MHLHPRIDPAGCRLCGTQCAQCRQLTLRLTNLVVLDMLSLLCVHMAHTQLEGALPLANIGRGRHACIALLFSHVGKWLLFRHCLKLFCFKSGVSFLLSGLSPSLSPPIGCSLCRLDTVKAGLSGPPAVAGLLCCSCSWLFSASAVYSPIPVLTV